MPQRSMTAPFHFEGPRIQAPFILRSARTVKRIDSLAVLQRIVRHSCGARDAPSIESANGVMLAPSQVMALAPHQVAEPHVDPWWVWPAVALGFIAMGGILALWLHAQNARPASAPGVLASAPAGVERIAGVTAPAPALAPARAAAGGAPAAPAARRDQTPPAPPARTRTSAESATVQRPAARSAYRTAQGTPLLVAAQDGPLAGAPGASRPALLRSTPAHGRVGFYADGHFSYRPDPGFTGSDSFRIQLGQSTGSDGMMTITIEVVSQAP